MNKGSGKFRFWVVFHALAIELFFVLSGQALADVSSKPVVETAQQMAVPQIHAGRFGVLPVQSANGRMIPMNTFSSEIIRKLYQNTRFGINGLFWRQLFP